MNIPKAAEIPTRLLRKPAVLSRIGLSDTTLWRLERSGEFPRAIRISARAVAWRESDVEQWIARRVANQGGAAGRCYHAPFTTHPAKTNRKRPENDGQDRSLTGRRLEDETAIDGRKH